jgi:Domain of unknown function (DUF3850)
VKTHELKCWPQYFQDIFLYKKRFELRKNDRDFKVDDHVTLREYDPITQKYSKRRMTFRIGYLLKDVESFGLRRGYVIIGLDAPLIDRK